MSLPTLQTIADLAGVSRSTVSLALRNRPNLSPETIARVKKIADEIGYRSNPLIATLMTHLRAVRPVTEQGTLAFVTNFPTRDAWRDFRTYQRFFDGATERADQNGYRLENFWLKEPRMTASKMTKVLEARGIMGALLAPLLGRGGHLSLDVSRLATVTYGLSIKRPNTHRVDNHQIESVRTSFRELTRLGYQRIGLAVELNDDRHVNYNWSVGYLACLQRQRKQIRIPIYEPEPGSSKESLLAWMEEFRPDAVLCVNDRLLNWIRSRYDIPGQVGFVILDRSDLDVGIAGVDGRPEILGASAIDLLIGQINRNERGIPSAPKLVLMEGVWVEGETVRLMR